MNLLKESLLAIAIVFFGSVLIVSLLLSSLFSKPQAPTTIIVERPGGQGHGLPGWGEKRSSPPPST